METLQQCPTCASRTRPGDAWCPVCYTQLITAPEPPPAIAVPLRDREHLADANVAESADLTEVRDAADGAGAADPGSRRSRRAERAEFELLADTMVAQLAASESGVKLPDPLERAFDSVGLRSSAKGQRIVGVAAVFGAFLIIGVAGMWIAGLVL